MGNIIIIVYINWEVPVYRPLPGTVKWAVQPIGRQQCQHFNDIWEDVGEINKKSANSKIQPQFIDSHNTLDYL